MKVLQSLTGSNSSNEDSGHDNSDIYYVLSLITHTKTNKQTTQNSLCWEAFTFLVTWETPHLLKKPEGPLSWSQEPAIVAYPGWHQYSPQSLTLLRSIFEALSYKLPDEVNKFFKFT
jgi:hypothetical protein